MVLRRKRFTLLRQRETFQVNEKNVLDYIVDNRTNVEITVGAQQIPIAANSHQSLGNPEYPEDIQDRVKIPKDAVGEVHVYGNILVLPDSDKDTFGRNLPTTSTDC